MSPHPISFFKREKYFPKKGGEPALYLCNKCKTNLWKFSGLAKHRKRYHPFVWPGIPLLEEPLRASELSAIATESTTKAMWHRRIKRERLVGQSKNRPSTEPASRQTGFW